MEKNLKPTHDSPKNQPQKLIIIDRKKAAVMILTSFALKIGLTSSTIWEILGYLKINIGGPKFEF